MEVCRRMDRVPWVPHPTAEGVRIKPIITRKDDGLDVTCILVAIPAGKEVGEHVHKDQYDILYPLAGKAVMWVDGVGEFELAPGVAVRVPNGTKHKIFEVGEDLLIYDVFCPAPA
ncbi:MAG: cupin domain-containing protein [Syntrophobacteraceae bacterium]|nr:cupin domain-containing protein [Syntrophobacteraceae bacterium]